MCPHAKYFRLLSTSVSVCVERWREGGRGRWREGRREAGREKEGEGERESDTHT